MIVPRIRLIVLIVLVLLPATGLAARYPDWTLPAWVATLLVLAAAVWDAAGSRRRFDGIAARAPAIVRMTVGRPAAIVLTLDNPRAAALPLRVGVALPPAFASDASSVLLRLPGGREAHVLTWPCRALQRGRFHLTAAFLEIPSFLGLWSLRRRSALQSELRAYPDLVSGQKQILGLFRRGDWGWRSVRKIGKGREFEQLRDYLPGDNYEDVDWKATARRRYPVTRVFQVEQSQEIYVILDASRLSTRDAGYVRERRRSGNASLEAGPAATIFEHYIRAALVLALAAEKASDHYGLLIFGARPDGFIKAGRGRTHYNACREALYNRMPQSVSPDFDDLFTFIGTHLRKRALLLFLTHLDDPLMSESFVHAMPLCARQHVLMVNMFRPAGAYPLFSSADIRTERGIYEHLAGHMLWSGLDETRRRLRQYGAGFALLDKEDLCSQLIDQYMEVKQRQVL